jgi:uncharacterized RDD family membrane protein YckC
VATAILCAMNAPAPDARASEPKPAALVGWRVLALAYDFFPVVALWMLASLAFTLGYTIAGHDPHRNIQPFSALQWALWITCWVLAGLYAVLSWHRGGQTLGMRPWRLRVTDPRGGRPTWRALWIRYAVASVSVLAAGLGFWWAWIDRDRMTWHDRASRTVMRREARRAKA